MITKGRIFNIQHFSVHDGPGIRTTVFLKGCPLRCRWCANPESQSFRRQPAWSESKCIACRSCVKYLGCSFTENGLKWEKPFCRTPQQVNDVCPGGALHIIGEDKTAAEVVDLVERDRPFFGADGGMTLSGGEPLAQIDFAVELLSEARRRGINTAVETCGCVPLKNIMRAAALTDNFITDVKCIDEKLHIAGTGGTNRQILENLKLLTARFPDKRILIRTPVIPGFNDNESELSAIARFAEALEGNIRWELLKYHKFGQSKYASLGMEYPMGDAELSQEKFDELKSYAGKLTDVII